MTGMPIWYELMTPDPGAVAAFYEAVGGWKVVDMGMTTDASGHDYRMIQRPDGGSLGGVLTMNRDMIDHGAKPGWVTYFHVDDVDASVAKIEALGGKTRMPARAVAVGRMAMVSDPQGAPFYVMSPTPPADQPDAKSDVFDETKAGHCRWNELSTSDEPGALKFYVDVLGWESRDKMPMGERGDYFFLHCEDRRIGAISPWLNEGQQPAWLFYMGVDDIDRAHAAAKANGGTDVGDPHEVPGGDWIFTANDPAGARLAFVGNKGA
jgi:predicted enzyme related to lactoylglutathione lyase